MGTYHLSPPKSSGQAQESSAIVSRCTVRRSCYLRGVADASSRESESTRPDSRMLQANERTLLAWLRTGLTLVAFGFVLARVDAWLHGIAPPDVVVHGSVATDWIGVGFVAVGLLANGLAVVRFVRARRALQMGLDLPTDVFPVAFSVAVTLLGVALAISLISRLVRS
jgi:putative membrane protein